jgi:hypothetical protein
MNEIETDIVNEKEEEISNEDYQKIVTDWIEGIRNNSLPVESILVIERLFRFMVNDYGPNIIGAICQNEIKLFNQLVEQTTKQEEEE